VTKKDLDSVDFVHRQLLDLDYGDVERAADGKSLVGAFILASCMIDHLAYFYSPFGDEDRGASRRFKEFCGRYLRNYQAQKLYRDLRCRLVHNYSEGGSYQFVSGQADLHLKPDSVTSRTLVNLENFKAELRHALDRLFADARGETKVATTNGNSILISANVISRFKATGILATSTRQAGLI